MILVDADFYIGLFHNEDAHNDQCRRIFPKIKENIITTWDVVDEVTTKLLYFNKKEIAVNFVASMLKADKYLVWPNHELLTLALKILIKQKNKHVSFTDCMNMAVAKEKNIEYLLSFDKNYEKNGFKLFK